MPCGWALSEAGYQHSFMITLVYSLPYFHLWWLTLRLWGNFKWFNLTFFKYHIIVYWLLFRRKLRILLDCWGWQSWLSQIRLTDWTNVKNKGHIIAYMTLNCGSRSEKKWQTLQSDMLGCTGYNILDPAELPVMQDTVLTLTWLNASLISMGIN